jgi:hypothetical protein
MANRFTATEKWIDPWFCGLNEKDKLFWIYLVDNCDHAGIWQVNWPLVQFYIKDYVFNETAFNGRIVQLKKDKWFIPKFIDFQYKTGLNPENRAHLSVINLLKKEGALKGLERSLQGRKDMDMVKDKVKDKGVIGGENNKFEEIWAKYPNKDGKKSASGYFQASVKTEQDWQDINKALENYLKSEKVLKGYIKNGSTWFNNWRDWIISPEPPVDPMAKYLTKDKK